MDVLIRTLPLHNANYGGILQNWALQQALRNIGVNPVTDLSVSPGNPLKATIKAFVLTIRNMVLPKSWNIIPGDSRRFSNKEILSFVDHEINGTSIFRPWSKKPVRGSLDPYGAFVSGSDQVWRAKYGNVSTYLFDFLSSSDSRPKIAYAGSFGTDPEQVLEQLTLEQCQDLFSRFDAVSSREDSGTEWIQSLGVQAQTMPDPTLLPRPSDYEALIEKTKHSIEIPSAPYLFAYILDPSESALKQLRETAEKRNLKLMLAGDTDISGRGQRISIEQWLANIRYADAVVTDSFHGMVFSTMFQKPFAAVPNAKRGADRFESFTQNFGLRSHLVTDFSQLENSLDIENIESLKLKLEAARKTGIEFLKASLTL